MPKKMQTGDGWGHGISRGIEEIGISRGVQEKVMCNFYGVLLLILESLRGVTQVCWISGRKKLVLSGISKIKVTNLKTPEVFFSEKYILNFPCLDFF